MHDLLEYIFFVYLCGMTFWLVWWFTDWFKEVSRMWNGWKDRVIDTLLFLFFLVMSFMPMGLYVIYISQK